MIVFFLICAVLADIQKHVDPNECSAEGAVRMVARALGDARYAEWFGFATAKRVIDDAIFGSGYVDVGSCGGVDADECPLASASYLVKAALSLYQEMGIEQGCVSPDDMAKVYEFMERLSDAHATYKTLDICAAVCTIKKLVRHLIKDLYDADPGVGELSSNLYDTFVIVTEHAVEKMTSSWEQIRAWLAELDDGVNAEYQNFLKSHPSKADMHEIIMHALRGAAHFWKHYLEDHEEEAACIREFLGELDEAVLGCGNDTIKKAYKKMLEYGDRLVCAAAEVLGEE